MELRSSRVLKSGRHRVVLGLENIKSPIAKRKRSSGNKVANEAERSSLRSHKKGANEAEIGVCVDNPDEDLEMGTVFSEGIKVGLNTDDKGLFLGSEVLDPIKDLPVSCSEGEIEEESVECVPVEEGNKSSTSETDHCFKEEIKSPLDCEHESEHVGSAKLADDTKIVHGDDLSMLNASKNADGGIDEVRQKKGRGRPRKKKRKISNLNKNEVEDVNGEVVESGIVKQKRGRKRKNVKKSECNGDERAKRKKVGDEKAKRKKVGVRVSERVLRLRNTVVSGGGTVVDGGQPEKKKKKKIERRGRPRKIHIETNEIPLKPLKKRGRPRKIDGENSQPKVKPKNKKLKQGKEKASEKKRLKDMILKKLKMRKRKLKLVAIKNSNSGLEANKVKRIRIRNRKSVVGEGIMGRGERKKLLREKLLDILSKSGWTFERRPRLNRVHQDMVYIEPNGRTHWSITRAYSKLTKKIKDGNADTNEVSAFMPMSLVQISMLSKRVDKELGCKKKKNRIQKDGKSIKKVLTTKKKKKDGKPKREKGIIVKNRKPRLLVRGSEKGTKQDNNGCLLYYNRKRNLLSWMIDSGVILSGWKVNYGKTRRKKKASEGTITSDGIVCSCCNQSMSISEFVGHSGGKLNQVFDDIYLESGVSFRKCLLDSWRKEEDSGSIRFNLVDIEGDDPNDDTCNICGDGGNLICCDGCPSTFHQSCLDIQYFPPGDWNCFYCSCKFCGVVSVIAPDKPSSEMLSCGLCEEKFHQSCSTEVGPIDMDSNRPPFCGQKCQQLFERLQTYIGVKNELEDGFTWSLLQRCDISQDLSIQDIKLKVENNSKLAVAFSVMDECFVPIVDGRSGTSIIHNVVYNCGSNFRRLNYGGFVTAVLEKGDELITAASIRLHGSRLAEMPFIGTRHMYRRQGMCRRLLDAIESTLSAIGVEELIIPAIPALLQTWTKVFGFLPLDESKKQELKCMSMIVFPGINMLQKPLFHPSASADSDEKDLECTTNDKSVSQTTPSNAIDCNEMPAENAIDCEKLETTSSNAVGGYEEKPPGVAKDASVGYEQMEEDIIIIMDNGGCPEDDKLTNSNASDNLYDLNFPVKNIPGCSIRPCSTMTCGPHQPSESESHVENGDSVSVVVKESPLTSQLVPKITFDLNLHPTTTVVDFVGDDSKPCDTRPLVLL
ncbi:hypothetical protein Lser_V15G41716 [Lactuca serriola]